MNFKHIFRMGLSLFGTACLTINVQTASAQQTCAPGMNCWISSHATQVRPTPPSTSVTRSYISNITIPGLNPEERLCPVQCPVTVELKAGEQVQQCFEICRPLTATSSQAITSESAISPKTRPSQYAYQSTAQPRLRQQIMAQPVSPPRQYLGTSANGQTRHYIVPQYYNVAQQYRHIIVLHPVIPLAPANVPYYNPYPSYPYYSGHGGYSVAPPGSLPACHYRC